MTNYERLLLELNNKKYLSENHLSVLLDENDLISTNIYNKNHRKALLYTVLSVLEILANDLDLFRKVETEFVTTSQAVEALNIRIRKVKNTIANLSSTGESNNSDITFLFFGG